MKVAPTRSGAQFWDRVSHESLCELFEEVTGGGEEQRWREPLPVLAKQVAQPTAGQTPKSRECRNHIKGGPVVADLELRFGRSRNINLYVCAPRAGVCETNL